MNALGQLEKYKKKPRGWGVGATNIKDLEIKKLLYNKEKKTHSSCI